MPAKHTKECHLPKSLSLSHSTKTLPIYNATFAHPIFKMRLTIKLLIQDHSQIFLLIRHPQFSTKKSRIIKTPNLSVIREQDHCCLDHTAYLRTCLFAAKPNHQRSPDPRFTSTLTMILLISTRTLRQRSMGSVHLRKVRPHFLGGP
jgi:hypothetical protein